MHIIHGLQNGFRKSDGTWTAGSRELFGNLNERRKPGYQVDAYIRDYSEPENNLYFAGWGKGCTLPFYYEGQPENDWHSYPNYIYEKIFEDCFSGGICKSVINIEQEENFSAHIKDNTISPYEGLNGMMKEFNMKDDGVGRRSSMLHCEIDFLLVVSSIMSLKLLKNIDIKNLPNNEKIFVGTNDFIYKYQHGYIGYSLGSTENDEKYFDKTIPVLIKYWNSWFMED